MYTYYTINLEFLLFKSAPFYFIFWPCASISSWFDVFQTVMFCNWVYTNSVFNLVSKPFKSFNQIEKHVCSITNGVLWNHCFKNRTCVWHHKWKFISLTVAFIAVLLQNNFYDMNLFAHLICYCTFHIDTVLGMIYLSHFLILHG